MNAPPFPTNPTVGEWFQNWVWNGARWVCSSSSGVRALIQVFQANGVYMPSPGLVTAIAYTVGGGGGGGAAAAALATWIIGGGGGGSGGLSMKVLPASLVLGGVTVTIAAGGLAGTAGGAGGLGGATTFGALCTAMGGLGGSGISATGTTGSGGDGAPIGVGDVCFPGNDGGQGWDVVIGTGGFSMGTASSAGGAIIGGSRSSNRMYHASVVGTNGDPNSGAGGGGALINEVAVAGSINGGAGGSGLCWVVEYCFADQATDGEDCCVPTVNVNARVTAGGQRWGPRPPFTGGPFLEDGGE